MVPPGERVASANMTESHDAARACSGVRGSVRLSQVRALVSVVSCHERALSVVLEAAQLKGVAAQEPAQVTHRRYHAKKDKR